MGVYNLTADLESYGNLPFDGVNYTSAVCVIPQFQSMKIQADRIEAAYYLILFFLAVDVSLAVLGYLRRRSVMS